MSVVVNRVRRGLYLDSVALMRLSDAVAALPGVERAALMVGTPSNVEIMADAGLLAADGRGAGVNDLVVAIRATDDAAGAAALAEAERLLDRPPGTGSAASAVRPRTLAGALDALPDASLALISVPGAFAAGEAAKALARGLDVMIFSDNVPVDAERALKDTAAAQGRLVMGPDCGTAIVGGVPLGFANAVPRGDVGVVAASGTGLQEVTCLLARAGRGISHAIGTGGRDLSEAVGGLTALAAIDALAADPATRHIVLISKPPAPAVAQRVLDRLGRAGKPATVCFLGSAAAAAPAGVRLVPTLEQAAFVVLGAAPPADPAAPPPAGLRWIRGLFTGGTLCGEAQVILMAAGHAVASNAPVPGAAAAGGDRVQNGHTLIDFGADEYTVGRPHPMIDPGRRDDALAAALAEPGVAAVLLDCVIGYGAHPDPAGAIAAVVRRVAGGPPVIASVTGTEADPQSWSASARTLRDAGVLVAPSNAAAARLAARIVAGPK
ncbi:MAG: acyl-CoA synthetase FdrA [Rhodospirillales bacterium]